MKFEIPFAVPSFTVGVKNPTIIIDLGSYSTKAVDLSSGKVLVVPSYVAVHTSTQEVIAVGERAKQLWNKSPESVSVIQPIKSGAIADFPSAKSLINHVFQSYKEIYQSPLVFLPQVLVTLSSNATPAQRNAVVRVLKDLLIQSSKYSDVGIAIGQYFHFSADDTTGKMIIDFGHQKTEIYFLVGQKIVSVKRLTSGGMTCLELIQKYIRTQYQLEVGIETAEDILAQLQVVPESSEHTIQSTKKKKTETPGIIVRGRNILTGLPTSIRVQTTECNQIVKNVLATMLTEIVEFLEDIPTALVSDVITQGICVTGGLSQIKGLSEYFSEYFAAKVFRAAEPETAIVLGAKKLADHDWKVLL